MNKNGPDRPRMAGDGARCAASMEPHPSGILLVLILYVAGTSCAWGFFSWHGLTLALAAMALTIRLHVRSDWRGPASEPMLAGILVGCCAMGLVLAPTATGDPRLIVFIRVLAGLALIGATAWLLPDRRFGRWAFPAMLLLAVAARVLVLYAVRYPPIDVFVSQTSVAIGLGEGMNGYAMTFTSPYQNIPSFDHYGYPPLTIYLNYLSWLFFKDVRAAWVICELLAALCVYRLAARFRPEARRWRELLALTALFLPRALFVVEQSWTEPMVMLSLGALALAASAAGSGSLAKGLAFGLLLSSKQYAVLLIPLVARLRRLRPAAWIIAFGLAGALALPFALWDFSAIKHDVFDFFLTSADRRDALSLYGAAIALGRGLPWLLVTPLWLAGVAFFTWRMGTKAQNGGTAVPSLARLLFAAAGMWMFFFLLGKQAFMNYFHLVAYTLLLAAAATPTPAEAQDAQTP